MKPFQYNTDLKKLQLQYDGRSVTSFSSIIDEQKKSNENPKKKIIKAAKIYGNLFHKILRSA